MYIISLVSDFCKRVNFNRFEQNYYINFKEIDTNEKDFISL